jgi:hypothetical protein
LFSTRSELFYEQGIDKDIFVQTRMLNNVLNQSNSPIEKALLCTLDKSKQGDINSRK